MQDLRREECRKAAGDCLEIANSTTDRTTRAKLLLLAAKFFDMANSSGDDGTLEVLIDEYNDFQMRK